MKPRLAWLGRISLLALLAGCAAGPRYQPPSLPSTEIANKAPGQALPEMGWWRSFGSDDLNRLMEAAAKQSPDIAAAQARIVEADAALHIAGSALLPSVSAGASDGWTKAGSASVIPGTKGSHYRDARSFGGKFSAAWELDFWGKNRAAREEAAYSLDAARIDLDAVWLATSAAIATSYFSALGAAEELSIAERNLRDQSEILEAFKARLEVGTASALDVSQQEALLAGTRARIPAFEGNYRQALYALSSLTGLPPAALAIKPISLGSLNRASVLPGLPADLLRRRPDVAEAEARLIAQNASLRQAIADRFPSLQLTASGGVSSLALDAITGPGSLAASFAGSLSQTVFDAGAKAGAVEEARGRFAELSANYVKSVLTALADTETTLALSAASRSQAELEAEAVRTARRASMIAHAQLAAGTVDIVTVLNTETTLFADEDNLAQIRTNALNDLVSLYKALGGGWQEADVKTRISK